MIHPKICCLLLLFIYFPIIFSPAALGNVRQQPSPCTLMYWMSRWSSLCVQGPLFSPAVCSRLQQEEEKEAEAEACFGAMLNPCTLHCPVRPSVRLLACLPACLSFTSSSSCVWILFFQAQRVFVFWDSRLHTVDVFHPQHHFFFFFLNSSSSATDLNYFFFFLLLLLLLQQQQIQNYFFFCFFFFFFFSNKFKTISSSSSTKDSKLFLLLLLLLLLQFFFFFSNRFKIMSSSSWILLLQQQQIQIKSPIIHRPSILLQACSKFSK